MFQARSFGPNLEATMASFENTVIIQRPVEEVFSFLADFENVPKWNYAIVDTKKERGGLRGDRLRAASPAGGAGPDRALPGEAQLSARTDGRRDKASQCRGPWVLRSVQHRGAARDPPRQACRCGQPRHTQATPIVRARKWTLCPADKPGRTVLTQPGVPLCPRAGRWAIPVCAGSGSQAVMIRHASAPRAGRWVR